MFLVISSFRLVVVITPKEELHQWAIKLNERENVNEIYLATDICALLLVWNLICDANYPYYLYAFYILYKLFIPSIKFKTVILELLVTTLEQYVRTLSA